MIGLLVIGLLVIGLLVIGLLVIGGLVIGGLVDWWIARLVIRIAPDVFTELCHQSPVNQSPVSNHQ